MPKRIVAVFESEEALDAAARAVQRAGHRFEAYGPYPLQETARLLGLRTWIVPLITICAGLAGAAGTYWLQYWMNAVDYPLNVGGRPLHAWPAFIPASIIVGVLAGGAATLLGMLVMCGLPRLEHPMFDVPGFEQASLDRYFLSVDSVTDADESSDLRAILDRSRPLALHEVAG